MPAIKFYKLFLANCILLASGAVANGQGVYEAWVARYNGPGNGIDQASALAVDASGNVYVTGYSPESGTADDYATIKYNSNGDSLWVRRYNGPGSGTDYAYDLAVDASGNVHVTGVSWSGTSLDYATIKYNFNGDTLWVKRYNGPVNLGDYASALAVDGSGNVYVTGYSRGSGTFDDYATIKYNSNGDSLWVRRYNGPVNSGDYASALAVDGSGNVYVTGYIRGSGTFDDYATIKYNSNGDYLWDRRYNGPGNLGDHASALAVDASGNVYVTGYSYGSGTFDDYATIKYNSNGDSLWVRRYNGPGNDYDYASALAVDGSGNVYVTGYSVGSGTFYDYATIKYNSNGDALWVRRYNGPGNDYDYAYALEVDGPGNVYVTGRSVGSGFSTDYATIKYNSNGDSLWVRRYNGPVVNADDEAYALAVDASGNVYVTGRSEGSGTFYDYATIKYSPCAAIPGDVNASGTISLGDVINLVNYYFDKDGPGCLGSDPGNCWTPNPICRGDVNNSGTISLGDVINLVNFYFDKSGPGCLGSDPGNCWTPQVSGACCLAVP